MAINATSSGTPRELIPAVNYIARCYKMIHIGTVDDNYMGQAKKLNKVRIYWELPAEMKIYKQENGEEPAVISKEFTLSMGDKANLRKMLASWRGKDFTEEEAKQFDITKLLGVACFLNIIHKPNKENTKTYEEIASVTPMPKGINCPAQINRTTIWDYDTHDYDVFNALPDFLKQQIQASDEYKRLHAPQETTVQEPAEITEPMDDLPF